MAKFKEEGAYTHLGYESVTLSADTVKSLGLSVDGDGILVLTQKIIFDPYLQVLVSKEENVQVYDSNPFLTSIK